MTETWSQTPKSMRITMRQIEAFDAVLKTGQVSAAAEFMSLSQPSVSRLVADLERNIGFALFVREKKRLIPTIEGRRFGDEVTRSFTGIERLMRFADDICALRTGSLRLGVMPALSFGAVPRAISQQKTSMPDVSILCEQRSSDAVLRSVGFGDVDLGIALDGPSQPGVRSLMRYETSCVCVMPEDHPLTALSVVAPRDLLNIPRVALPHYTVVSVQLNKILLDAGIDPRPGVEALVSSMACAMVAEGIGVSILDPFTARGFIGRGIVSRPFSPTIQFNFRVVQPDGQPLSRMANSFVEKLKAELDRDPLARPIR